MKRYLSLLLGSIAIASCMTSGDADDGAGEKNDGIYYKTQAAADTALAAFDKANPSCQLWSNWQKMCSRTGPEGRTWCATDAKKPARPSAPFCAGDVDGLNRIEASAQTKEQKSRDRFCLSFDSNSTISRKLGRPICLELDKQRPFGGYDISTRAHPWCTEWKDKSTFQRVGSMSDQNSDSGFYCSIPDIPKWCKQADGLGAIPLNSPDHPKFGSGSIMVLGIVDNTANARIVGIICKRKV